MSGHPAGGMEETGSLRCDPYEIVNVVMHHLSRTGVKRVFHGGELAPAYQAAADLLRAFGVTPIVEGPTQ